MYSFNGIDDFYKKFCSYYLALEADFLATERYLTIDKDNYTAFSNEYPKKENIDYKIQKNAS